MTERHLAQTEGHVRLSEQHVMRQRELIAKLKRGADTTEAEALLTQFEEQLRLHVEHRDRLRRELDAL